MKRILIYLSLVLSFISPTFGQQNAKSKTGEVASDFTFLDNKGKEHYMSDIEAQYIVLFFYNPDCEHCQKYLKSLKKDKLLATYTKQKAVAVIAVAVETDQEAFGANFFDLPIEWNKGFCEDCEEIIDHYLEKVPSIFVLDDIKMVIKSNIEPKELENFLKTISIEGMKL
ncbi:MAG: peroxiredoxin family protein [Bacteroidales bacterium]|jgi:thioredoxin-related protein|nr:peroxiredoxin family protein [Bacteroidales bacterium]